MNKIKYVHLQVEKDGEKIIYTIYDMQGALTTFKNKEDVRHYFYIFNNVSKRPAKLVDIIHINYNLQCNQLAF